MKYKVEVRVDIFPNKVIEKGEIVSLEEVLQTPSSSYVVVKGRIEEDSGKKYEETVRVRLDIFKEFLVKFSSYEYKI